jgi:hypothetical protein
MTWTAPRTWVAEEVVTAALMNTHVRDNLIFLAGTHNHGTAAGHGSSRLGPITSVEFIDAAGNLSTANLLYRNGTSLRFNPTPTSTVVLSEPTAVGIASVRDLGVGGTQGAAGDHGHTLNNVANVTRATGTGGYGDWGTMGNLVAILSTGTLGLISTSLTPTNTNGLLVMSVVVLVRTGNPAATSTGSLWIHRTIAGTGTVQSGTVTHTLVNGSTTAFVFRDSVAFPTLLAYNWTIRGTADISWKVAAYGMQVQDFTF